MVHKESGAVVELKTTNSTKVMKEPYSSHLKQLKTYMSILKDIAVEPPEASDYGKLFYIFLRSDSSNNCFIEYLVTLDANERKQILENLEQGALELQRGINSKNLGEVSHIALDPNYYSRWTRQTGCAIDVFKNEDVY